MQFLLLKTAIGAQKFFTSYARTYVRETRAQKQTRSKPSEQQIKAEEVRVRRDQGGEYRGKDTEGKTERGQKMKRGRDQKIEITGRGKEFARGVDTY